MTNFSVKRCVELSSLDYLTTQLNASWTGITVVKSFNQAYDSDKNLPIVAAYIDDTTSTRREVGSTALDSTYSLVIDIFARSDGQRQDLSAFILDKLKDGFVYYIYSQQSGAPQTLSTVASGRVYVQSFDTDTAIRFSDIDVDVKDRFRHTIIVTLRKS